ncbi:MAG TPA: hypothetical protein VFA04_09190 [Bryobacteraceae bacterium]|nr:hypothetical protein [Bryobacteraceae bacterium]
MGYSQRILDRFPSFMRAEQPGKALGSVTFALGGQLDEAERLANNIQKAHRIAVADEERDIVQLASLLGLQLADFFILRTFYENGFFSLTEKDVSVAFKGGATEFVFVLKIRTLGALADIRAEIQANVQLLLTPPTTVIAVKDVVNQTARSALFQLEGAQAVAITGGDNATLSTVSVALGAPQDAEDGQQRSYAAYLDQLRTSVERVANILFDGCGTIYALLEGTSVLLDAETTGPVEHTDANQARGGFVHRIPITYTLLDNNQPVEKQGFIYMVENPMVDKKTDNTDREQREPFQVKRGGFYPGPVSVQVTGVGDRTVLPRVVNETTHEGVGFRKALTGGQTLLFSAKDGKTYLDGADATASAYYFKGALFDLSQTDSKEPVDLFPVATPPGSLDRNYPRPTITPAAKLPVITLPLGVSNWRFSVEDGAFDASGFDEAVFAGPPSQPSARVELLWQEEKPFAVTILIPAELKPLEASVLGGADLRKLVRAGLERFRTAGIEVDVDYFDPKWIASRSNGA